MNTRISNTWWDSYRETVKATKLFRELVSLVNDREDVAQNMLNLAKQRNPGKAEIWYLNQLVLEIKHKTKSLLHN